MDMKRIATLLIIVLLAAAMAFPVTAAKDSPGSGNGEGGGSENAGQGVAQKIHETDANATLEVPVRDQIRNESRAEIQSGNLSGNPVQNRTEARIERQNESGSPKMPPGQNGSNGPGQGNSGLNGTPPGLGLAKNQNEVRFAVHQLLAMENQTGGIGPQVSAIAKDFNNSIQSTWQLENQIDSRDAFSKFLFGNDKTSAAQLNNLTIQNQVRIQEMQQLIGNATIDNETRLMLQDQLQIMQQENTRLNEYATSAAKNRGIFGWFG